MAISQSVLLMIILIINNELLVTVLWAAAWFGFYWKQEGILVGKFVIKVEDDLMTRSFSKRIISLIPRKR